MAYTTLTSTTLEVSIADTGRQMFGTLQRAFGVAFGVAITVGGTLGVGILRRPGTVANSLPAAWAIYVIWIAGGVFAMLGALCVAELSTMMPTAGGFLVFARRAFGPRASFAVGWCDWLANAAAVAYGAIAAAEVIPRFLPAMVRWTTAVAIGIAVLFAAAQCRGVRTSDRLQRCLSALVCIAFAILVVGCFIAAPLPANAPARPLTVGAWVIAFRAVMVSYDGWYEPAYFAEETADPSRSLPRALVAGVALVTAIYVLVNAGLVRLLSPGGLAGSELPVADAARRIAGAAGDSLVAGLSLLALLPMTNASLLGGARICFALARESGARRITNVNQGGSPWVATVVTAIAAAALIATGTFDTLLAMAAVWMALLYCSAYGSLIVLRRREPRAPRPFVLRVYPAIPVALLAVGVAFLAGIAINDVKDMIAAAAGAALSYPMCLLFRRQPRPAGAQNLSSTEH